MKKDQSSKKSEQEFEQPLQSKFSLKETLHQRGHEHGWDREKPKKDWRLPKDFWSDESSLKRGYWKNKLDCIYDFVHELRKIYNLEINLGTCTRLVNKYLGTIAILCKQFKWSKEESFPHLSSTKDTIDGECSSSLFIQQISPLWQKKVWVKCMCFLNDEH